MWFLLLKGLTRRIKKAGLFKYFIIGTIVFMFGLVFIFSLISDDVFLMSIVKHEENNLHANAKKSAGKFADIRDKYNIAYDVNNPGATSGTRGNGVNLLLINSIQTEGYVKEMLTLYKDSYDGKVSDSQYHLPVETLIGMNKNESGMYPGTPIPRSLLPYKDHKIIWKEDLGSIPAEAMTLRGMNGTYFSTLGDVNIPPINSNTYKNSFQVNEGYFSDGSVKKAKINGYGKTDNRNSDPYFLPDSLSYIDQSYTYMINQDGLQSTDYQVLQGLYGAFHNGGEGHVYGIQGFASFDTSRVHSPGEKEYKAEFEPNVTVIAKDIIVGAKKYGFKMADSRTPSVAAFMLLEQGYYLTPTAVSLLMADGYAQRESVKAWNLMYGENLTAEQLRTKLNSYVKSITDVYPNYASAAEISRVYGVNDNVENDKKGAIWKLSDNTSKVYKNTINGNAPRVLHRSNMEVIGYMLDSSSWAPKYYADMLKYAGVGVDPTNPDTYMNNISDNEFKPGAADFDGLLKKMNAPDMPKGVHDMLQWGYENGSGFLYYLGGYGLPVSVENFAKHYEFRTYDGNTLEYLMELYKTKDGTTPKISHSLFGGVKLQTTNDNLLYYGKGLWDCSQLTAQSYNKTIGKNTGTSIPPSSYSQYDSSQLVTISDWTQAQPGDIFVSKGHVFFFITWNKTGSSQSLDMAETRTEKVQTARSGSMWALEASTSGEMVGIRQRPAPAKGTYILRRFKTLM